MNLMHVNLICQLHNNFMRISNRGEREGIDEERENFTVERKRVAVYICIRGVLDG